MIYNDKTKINNIIGIKMIIIKTKNNIFYWFKK